MALALTSKPTDLAPLERKRNAQIMAVGIGLSGITANSLPAVMKHGDQLSLLKREDEPTLLKALIILIGITNDALNVPRMNASQMLDAARHISKTFWYLKLEEIAYAFDQGRAGRYGKAYNRLDLEGLEAWIVAYDTNERLLLCERSRSEQITEDDNRHTVEVVHESYQRFSEGEPLHQQKVAAQKREADQKALQAKNKYYQFRESYFTSRPKPEGEQEPDNDLPNAH